MDPGSPAHHHSASKTRVLMAMGCVRGMSIRRMARAPAKPITSTNGKLLGIPSASTSLCEPRQSSRRGDGILLLHRFAPPPDPDFLRRLVSHTTTNNPP